MRRDKRFLDVDGIPLLDRVLQALSAVCEELFIVAAELETGLSRGGAQVVIDEIPGTGTLGGAYTGLLHATCDRAVVVACDLPYLNRSLLRWMAARDPAADILMPRLSTGLQPTHAIYRKSCLPAIEGLLRAGQLKAQHLVEQPGLHVTMIEEAELRPHDPNLLSFLNLNTPADLEMARKLLASGTGRA